MLSDRQAEDCGGRWELESVAEFVSSSFLGFLYASRLKTHIATLWEMIVFSVSSNDWNSVGLRTFCASEIKLAPVVKKSNLD